jgi:peroxiredoxin
MKMFRHTIKLHPFIRFYSVEASKINVKPSQPIKLFKTDKQPITTDELFAPGKTVVIFGVPGAFTPVCSLKHVSRELFAFTVSKGTFIFNKCRQVEKGWC